MSMSNGNPPVGYGYGVPHNDPEEPAEQRQGSGGQEAQDRLGMLDRELPDEPMDPERRAEEIVVREQGVNSFAHAEEADRMERPPSVRDQATNETTGNLITDAVRGARVVAQFEMGGVECDLLGTRARISVAMARISRLIALCRAMASS